VDAEDVEEIALRCCVGEEPAGFGVVFLQEADVVVA
jgi:hypothetical protein